MVLADIRLPECIPVGSQPLVSVEGDAVVPRSPGDHLRARWWRLIVGSQGVRFLQNPRVALRSLSPFPETCENAILAAEVRLCGCFTDKLRLISGCCCFVNAGAFVKHADFKHNTWNLCLHRAVESNFVVCWKQPCCLLVLVPVYYHASVYFQFSKAINMD